MLKKIRFPKIYLGWWMNLVMGILSGIGGGLVFQGHSALFKPIASELGIGRAAASLANSVARLEGGIQSPITGMLCDRFGPKWVVFAGTCLTVAGLIWMNFINSPWTYYVAWGVIVATGSNLGFTIAHDKVVTDWFISKRGLAFGVRFALIGIMGAIVLPVISWLITTQGWRTTCLIWAAILVSTIPLVLYFVKQKRPEYYGLLPDGAAVEPGTETGIDAMVGKGVEYAASFQETEFSLREAMRTPAYWILTVAGGVWGIVNGGINLHVIPFLTDMGIDPVVAGGMMAMMLFFTVPSRFFGGFIADRVKKEHLKFVLAGAFIVQAMGITAFLLRPTIATVYVFLILYGLGGGTFSPLGIAMRGRYFGRKAYGSIQGTSRMFVSPITLLAPVYAGWVYDTSGSYLIAFTTFAVITGVAAFLVCMLRVPKAPSQVTY